MTSTSYFPSGALARLQRPDFPKELDYFSSLDLASALLKRIEGSHDDLSTLQQWASILSMELERTVRLHDDRFSKKRLVDNFDFLFFKRLLNAADISGKTVVELGCGSMNPLARLLVFLMLGAERAIGFDLDDLQDPRMAALYLARTAAWMLMNPEGMVGTGHPTPQDMLKNLEVLDLQRLDQGDLSGIYNTPLEFRQESLYDMALDDNSVDVVFSMSFLEHIPDCPEAVAVMHRIMKPGAIAIHAIDGFDHAFYGSRKIHPLEFLKIETPEPLVRGCNRVRPLEFIRLFEEGGFEIVATESHSPIDLESIRRQDLAMPFRIMSDEMLRVGRIHIYARKR